MIVRVNWGQPNADGNHTYHTYEASDFYVEAFEKETPRRFRLVLDASSTCRELFLCGGDTAFIMNNEGKTIDTIRT